MKLQFKKTASFVIILCITAIASTTYGQQRGKMKMHQDGPPPITNSEEIANRIHDLSKSLSLNEEQSNQISALFAEHFKEVKENRENNESEREKNRQKTDLSRKIFENKVSSLLTKEQKIKFENFKKNQKPPFKREARMREKNK